MKSTVSYRIAPIVQTASSPKTDKQSLETFLL